MVTRTGREFAGAHAARSPAQGLPGDLDLEFRQYPLAETCDPPAHHNVKFRCRPLLDHLRQCPAVPVVKDPRRTGGLAVDQANRAGGVEPQHPIANDLQRHPANPRRALLEPRLLDRAKRSDADNRLLVNRPGFAGDL